MTTTPTESAKTIDEFDRLTSLQGNDVFIVVKNRTGVNLATYSVTLDTLFSNSVANVVISNTSTLSVNTFILRNNQTPANSTATFVKGTFLFDNTYFYVATANNVLKRFTLESF